MVSCVKPNPIAPCFGSLTCPRQQDAITSIPQVASTCVHWVCFITFVWISDQSLIITVMAKVLLLRHRYGVPSNMALHLPSMVPYWIHMELQRLPLISLYSRRETIVEDPRRARGCGWVWDQFGKPLCPPLKDATISCEDQSHLKGKNEGNIQIRP